MGNQSLIASVTIKFYIFAFAFILGNHEITLLGNSKVCTTTRTGAGVWAVTGRPARASRHALKKMRFSITAS